MSAKNTLEAKAYRRTRKATRKLLNKDSHYAQPVAKYGYDVLTGRWMPVDFEHNICEAGWMQIARFSGNRIPRPAMNRKARRELEPARPRRRKGEGYV